MLGEQNWNMDEHTLIERVYDHVESGAVDKAAVACLRLARKVGDSFSVIIFLRELYPDRHQLKVAFLDETQHPAPPKGSPRFPMEDNTGSLA